MAVGGREVVQEMNAGDEIVQAAARLGSQNLRPSVSIDEATGPIGHDELRKTDAGCCDVGRSVLKERIGLERQLTHVSSIHFLPSGQRTVHLQQSTRRQSRSREGQAGVEAAYIAHVH